MTDNSTKEQDAKTSHILCDTWHIYTSAEIARCDVLPIFNLYTVFFSSAYYNKNNL